LPPNLGNINVTFAVDLHASGPIHRIRLFGVRRFARAKFDLLLQRAVGVDPEFNIAVFFSDGFADERVFDLEDTDSVP